MSLGLEPSGQAHRSFVLPGPSLFSLPRELTTVCSPQRLLLLLQDKDKEVEELLQEIQCEKVPSPTVAPPYGVGECILPGRG